MLFLIGCSLQAAPVGNPSSPSILEKGFFIPDQTWCEPKITVLQDFTVYHQLIGSKSSIPIQRASFQGTSTLAAVTWSMFERADFSFFAGSGQSSFEILQNESFLQAQFQGGLIWYGEGKVILIEMKETSFSAFGEAGGWDWMNGPFFTNSIPTSNRSALKMRYWQAGVALSQKLPLFSPYIGAVVMQTRWQINQTPEGNYYLKQKYPVGPLLGCSITTFSTFLLNIEWRGWVENAFSLLAEARF